MEEVLYTLFIGFGVFAIFFPEGISGNDMETSYTVKDLIKGWGIYATLVGLMLASKKKYTLLWISIALMISILWHIDMMNNRCITAHHVQAIWANIFALVIVSCIAFENESLLGILKE